MKMKNPLEPAGRTALAASRELLALEPEEKALALRLMAAGVRSAAERLSGRTALIWKRPGKAATMPRFWTGCF